VPTSRALPHTARPLRIACVGHAALDHVFEVEQIPGGSSKTLARRYQALAGSAQYLERIEVLVAEMLKDEGVRLPGARREALRRKAEAEGIEVAEAMLVSLRA
jgi:LDH2 family malate/lactate/ureidoglycolate dehydrogenase